MSRPLKKAHLRRCPASPLAATYLEYAYSASGTLRRMGDAALHLDHFERPSAEGFKSRRTGQPQMSQISQIPEEWVSPRYLRNL